VDAASTVYLFDVDGTLVSTGGAGRRALRGALERVCGAVRDDPLDFSFAGCTDRWIVRRGLERCGASADAGVLEAVFEAYVRLLPAEVAAVSDYVVHPGVPELLAALPGRALGLGTGNIERGARIKLARGGLDTLFDFGGFGSDAEDRAELLRVGAERGARALDCSLDRCRVIVVGDTVRDVRAARAIGAECLGVMTGGTDEETFRSEGADLVVGDLRDERAREFLL
jgi:phosphoglycolate phosphatase-like HAD superfamily hydrolase